MYYESGFYTDTIPNDDGCYTIVHLDLDLNLTPSPSEIFPADTANHAPHWVITATEFQIFTYDFTLWSTNEASHWDSIRWEFENPGLNWVLEPDSTTYPVGKNIKIYVLEQVNDTVWLKATVYNSCEPQGIERRYWFVSSFYGIEEDGPSTGSGTLSNIGFEVTPNPNHGQMLLNFENIIGKVDLKVFNSQGALIDQFQIHCETSSYSFPYECGSQENGLYFFVATWNSKVLTKKVIVFQ